MGFTMYGFCFSSFYLYDEWHFSMVVLKAHTIFFHDIENNKSHIACVYFLGKVPVRGCGCGWGRVGAFVTRCLYVVRWCCDDMVLNTILREYKMLLCHFSWPLLYQRSFLTFAALHACPVTLLSFFRQQVTWSCGRDRTQAMPTPHDSQKMPSFFTHVLPYYSAPPHALLLVIYVHTSLDSHYVFFSTRDRCVWYTSSGYLGGGAWYMIVGWIPTRLGGHLSERYSCLSLRRYCCCCCCCAMFPIVSHAVLCRRRTRNHRATIVGSERRGAHGTTCRAMRVARGRTCERGNGASLTTLDWRVAFVLPRAPTILCRLVVLLPLLLLKLVCREKNNQATLPRKRLVPRRLLRTRQPRQEERRSRNRSRDRRRYRSRRRRRRSRPRVGTGAVAVAATVVIAGREREQLPD